MDSTTLQSLAEKCLGVVLTDSEASALVGPYMGLQEMIRTLEAIPLPYTEDPFLSPGSGDAWLESWPGK